MYTIMYTIIYNILYVHIVLPLRDRILTRLGTSDDLEHNLSSFKVSNSVSVV